MHVEIKLEAHFETPFNVGSGVVGDVPADRPLLKDSLGQPYLPGSMLKGLLRHEAERLARAIAGDGRVCHAPRAETMCPQQPVFGKFCPVCRTFGSPALPSPLRFSDLRAVSADAELVKSTTLRHGVGVSRYRGAAAEDFLYTSEVAATAPAVAFHGVIGGDLPDGDAVGAVALLLAALNSLRAIGSGKSGGLGWVRFEVTGAKPNLATLEGEGRGKELEKWLQSGSK